MRRQKNKSANSTDKLVRSSKLTLVECSKDITLLLMSLAAEKRPRQDRDSGNMWKYHQQVLTEETVPAEVETGD